MKGTQRSKGNTRIQDPERCVGGYDDEKPGGRQELAQRGPAPQAPEMKARGFHLALRMLMFTSRWGLLLNQKNKISCELTACSERRLLGAG